MENPDATSETLRGGNLDPSKVAENKTTEGTKFSLEGGELEKLEQEAKNLKAQKSLKPGKQIFTGDNLKVLKTIPEPIKQLKDGSFFIKDIDDFLSFDKESPEYKEVEKFLGKDKLDEIIKNKEKKDRELMGKSADQTGGDGIGRIFGKSKDDKMIELDDFEDLTPEENKMVKDNLNFYSDDSFDFKDIDKIRKLDRDSPEFKAITKISDVGEIERMLDAPDDPFKDSTGLSLKDNLNFGKLKKGITDNKALVAGGLAVAGLGGLGLGEAVELGKDAKSTAENLLENKKLTETVKKDGDEIKKKLDEIDDKDGNTAIAQIITNADDDTKNKDNTPTENKQLEAGLKDIENQIRELILLQNTKATTIQQINEPTSNLSNDRQNRRTLKTIDRDLVQGKTILNRKASQMQNDLEIVAKRRTRRKIKKEAMERAKKNKDEKMISLIKRGVLSPPPQPAINIFNNNGDNNNNKSRLSRIIT